MRISELSRRTGVAPTTLRHYERLGLLRPSRSDNGYRDYPESACREVVFVAMSRRIGLPLKTIAEHLPAYRAGRLRAEDIIDTLRQHIAQIDAQRDALDAQKSQILEHIRWFADPARDHRQDRPDEDETPP